jgi:hypothetical protein
MKGGAGSGALEAHHERTKEKYASNPDIDTAKSSRNFHIVKPETSYKRASDGRIDAAGCKTRKDSVRFVDTLITASPEFFKGKKREEVKAFFNRAAEFMADKVGAGNIFTAVVHMDEKTPHMHLCFTPITEDGRLTAKEVIGDRNRLTQWQDDYFAHMVKAYPDLERGESASETHRRHIPTRVFKQAVRLTKQMLAIKTALDGINPLNAGKRRDEALALLKKSFPGMEDFEKQLRKYRREIKELEADKAELKQKAEAAETKAEANAKTSLAKQMHEAQLQVNYNELRKFVDALPDEIKRQAQQQQSQKSQNHIR